METTETKQFFSNTKSMIEKYIDNRWLLFRMEVVEKSSPITTNILVGLGLLFCGICFLFFLSVLAAYAIGSLVDNTLAGFAIVSGLYLLLIIGFWVGRHTIIRKISDLVIKIYFRNKEPKNAKKHTYTNIREAAKQ